MATKNKKEYRRLRIKLRIRKIISLEKREIATIGEIKVDLNIGLQILKRKELN